jgi:hypothetical protein
MIPYAILAASIFFLGAYVLLALSREGWRRWGGPAVFGAMVGLMFALTFLSLGAPRPGWLYTAWGPDVEVLSATWEEGKTIWVWVRFPGQTAPVSIALPWSEGQAENLHRGIEGAMDTGGTVEIQLGGATGPEAPSAVHVQPPPAMPLKE